MHTRTLTRTQANNAATGRVLFVNDAGARLKVNTQQQRQTERESE